MGEELYKFDVEFLAEAYNFLQTLNIKTQEKILENIRIARFKTDPKLLKKIDREIWEFRTRYSSKQIRLLAFWDKRKNALMICTHGFVKKTNKIPAKELKKAKQIRNNYLTRK